MDGFDEVERRVHRRPPLVDAWPTWQATSERYYPDELLDLLRGILEA